MREAVRTLDDEDALADRAQAGREAARRRAGRPALLRRRQLLARAGRARLLVVADRPLRADGHDALVDLEHAPRDGGVRVHPLDVLAAAAAELRQLRASSRRGRRARPRGCPRPRGPAAARARTPPRSRRPPRRRGGRRPAWRAPSTRSRTSRTSRSAAGRRRRRRPRSAGAPRAFGTPSIRSSSTGAPFAAQRLDRGEDGLRALDRPLARRVRDPQRLARLGRRRLPVVRARAPAGRRRTRASARAGRGGGSGSCRRSPRPRRAGTRRPRRCGSAGRSPTTGRRSPSAAPSAAAA